MSDAIVRDQYEAYPYPPRAPEEERTRLITGSPSQLDELVHYVFGGQRESGRRFRALVAGGGTGDATIMLAQQLADSAAQGTGGDWELVYLDMSTASRDIARARAEVRGLDKVRFEHGSLLDLSPDEIGAFDYIDCCGVLHHLKDPAAGLAALVSVLAEDGGLGLMLYGSVGRSGVYEMQDMLRLIAPADSDPAPVRLNVTRRLLKNLPDGNLLRRNPFVEDIGLDDDAHLFDLLLHSQDRAYRVPDIVDLLAGAGLRLVSFIPPALYDPTTSITDPALTTRLERLSPVERAAFAELLAGSLRKHIFYAVKADNPVTPPDPTDPTAIPIFIDMQQDGTIPDIKAGLTMAATIEGVTYKRPIPDLTGAILRRADGYRTLGQIHTDIVSSVRPLSWSEFSSTFLALYEVLNSLGKLVLRKAV